jgi:UDP-N-acetylmuramate--alanine ligase
MGRTVESVVSPLRMESQRPSPNGRPSRFAGKRVHLIGIGGCGMSGLARILMDAGAIVSGSEPKPNTQTFELTKRGARISRTQGGELLSRDVDLIVRTAAVKDDNPEYVASRALGIRGIKYAQMLGEVMAERFGIAVAGTHGKSTTTAMTAWALTQCEAHPSWVVGGTVPQLGHAGSHSGASDIFVAEACEFDRSFHNLRPKVAIITNIEEDHLDCYSGIEEINESFHEFAKLVPTDGLIISNAADRNCNRALSGISTPIEMVSLGGESIWSTRDLGVENGCHRGVVSYRGREVGEFRLSIAGVHNLMNATMALAAMNACGIELGRAIAALSTFTGVDRRMTEMGRRNGAILVDDYGHHPTEIRATLGAIREKYQPKRLICVFQPHQHSRTRFLLEDFAASFTAADETIVPDIYFVRDSESERQRVSSADLVDRIIRHGQQARHIADFPGIIRHLQDDLRDGDVLVTMGAGNVWEIARDLAG